MFVFTLSANYMYIVYNYMSHYINVGYGISISMKGLYPGHNGSKYYPTRTQIEESSYLQNTVLVTYKNKPGAVTDSSPGKNSPH